MAGMNWTDAQNTAIYDRGGALLVSAAAGSGKTAVLTERVVELLKDIEHPISADRLLIVTFTNAAAAELRARIAARLEQIIALTPSNQYLRRQKMLLQRAHICTIDAFCLQLVQRHFTALDVPPDFTLADAGVAEKLKGEALAQTLEEAYHDPDFCGFVDMYGKGRSDVAASSAILQLYYFLRTMPDADIYQADILQQWTKGALQPLADWCERLRTAVEHKRVLGEYFAKQAQTYCEFDYEDALAVAAESKKTDAARDKAIAKVNEKYQKVFHAIEGLMDAFAALAPFSKQPFDVTMFAEEGITAWNAMDAQIATYRNGTQNLPGIKNLRVRFTGANGAGAKQAVEQAADFFAQIVVLVPCNIAQAEADRALAHPRIAALCRAQTRFSELFYRKKIEKKVLEFSDLEHLALELLQWNDGVPTPLAQSISDGFDAVMVDEYQDTNALQERIYRRLANKAGDNLFFVGDLKQSIYRFRQAEPDIFAQKLTSFAPLAENCARPAPVAGATGQDGVLALDANFRSTAAVVDGVNFVFGALMNPTLGGVLYGEGQRLVCKSGGSLTGSVSLLLDTEGGQDAAQVAAKIAQLVALGAAGDVAGMVRDGAALRPIQYEDCCILLSTRTPFAQYANALAAQGISVYADSAEDLLSASHIQPLVALLQVIDNPAQDIPLAAVMLSMVFAFTEDDLLELRLHCRKGSLYGAVVQVAQEAAKAQQPDVFGQRVAGFYETLSALRRLSHTVAPEELLEEIFAATHYLALVGAMENGVRRREDVAKFAAYAATAGANGIESLVRNIEQTKASGGLVDSAPGKTKPGCVTIMTIHRSKGLQFPVVFVANLDHRFNTDDLKQKMLLHKTLGLGLQLRAGQEGSNYHTLASTALCLAEKQELYSEGMRLLYVALTRAQDHLYLSGTAKNLEKRLTTMAYRMQDDLGAFAQTESCFSASCFMDWLLIALLRHPSCRLLREMQQADGVSVSTAEHAIDVKLYQQPEEDEATQVQNVGLTATPDAAMVAQLCDGFAWQYPHAALTSLPAKVSVTSLVHKEQNTILARPAFLAKDGMTAAEKGTALHAFLENADFATLKQARADGKDALRAALRTEQTRQETERRMLPELAEKLDMQAVEAFFMGEAFRRIAHATQIYREYAFITGLPAQQVLQATAAFDGKTLPVASQGDTAGATVLVQGIADLLLVYPDHLELLDYKSDHGKNEEAYRKAYAKQLDYYAKAIEKRFAPLPLTYKAIYSFDLAKLIVVE